MDDGLTVNGRTPGTDYGRGAARPLAELVRTLADGSNGVIEAVWAHSNALSGNNEWTDSVVNHASVTWIEDEDQAHGWSKPETGISFYDDVLKFLDANTAPGSAAAAH